jgi:hexosaminidase
MLPESVQCVTWSPKGTDEGLQAALRILAQEYPIRETAGGAGDVRFEAGLHGGGYSIVRSADDLCVRYGSVSDALRAVGSLLAGLGGAERPCFSTLGIMLDCSRNAVMRVEHFEGWLRRLALLGYNMAMLYTEDTYEIPGEPWFGYQRGAYTAAELREIDDYADALGIEMIPCIQVLGHLEQVLKWPAYLDVTDDRSVLLIDEPKTYELIDKMLAQCADVFRSRRIHLGMDECWSLGLGRYVRRFGYVPGWELFLRHLEKVAALCQARGLEPMLWSDMFFRLGSGGEPNQDYDRDAVVPPEIIARVPNSLRMVYWEYEERDTGVYVDWIGRHRAFGSEPILATALDLAKKLWLGGKRQAPLDAGIDACRETDVKEMFVCMWGDDGGCSDFDSALSGLAFAAEKAYAPQPDEDALARRFAAVCGADYATAQTACEINALKISPACILWDDPLLGIYLAQQRDELAEAARHFDDVARQLAPHADERAAGDLNHARLIAEALAAKLRMSERLTDAYSRGDREALAALRGDIPQVTGALRALLTSFRAMWMRHNKPQGFEVIQIRFAGLIERYGELSVRLGEYLDGQVETIDELDANLPEPPPGGCGGRYHGLATGSCIL